ncbi:uncharacterized protein LOC128872336 isoform X1 [Hylaeus volcanicus]|uniref:uncharacterized protein LOC128872336 isoform X1 n=1 Tax=Hylaeus volcanicus TaxID=313075 RepID=UPI0023B7FF6E|nr:uncharacterized protein LOC128872336 isoform X1 [Hylaeus volcanicus]
MDRYSIKSDKQIFPIESGAGERLIDRDIVSLRNVFTFAVMVPVSSTVIPLTMYKGEYDLRFISKNKKAQSLKPEDGAKLITMKKSQEKKT